MLEQSRSASQSHEALERFRKQARQLGHKNDPPAEPHYLPTKSAAVEAKFITGQDVVVETANGGRLPVVPVSEALELNDARARLEGRSFSNKPPDAFNIRRSKEGAVHGSLHLQEHLSHTEGEDGVYDKSLSDAPPPPSSTNPLFPELPLYGPPSWILRLQSLVFRSSAFILSFNFLLIIVLSSIATGFPSAVRRSWRRIRGQSPYSAPRRFHEEEHDRRVARKEEESRWQHQGKSKSNNHLVSTASEQRFPPLEGGPDPLVPDPSYYARRVGLDMEKLSVKTEDGFIIDLWHVLVPGEHRPVDESQRGPKSSNDFNDAESFDARERDHGGSITTAGRRRYPVLLMHGLLQSAGAYCCTDDDSLAFFLAKSGYDVWLGNNRCGFDPRHELLNYSDPRMWAWNIRQMGVMDLPALVSRVLSETGFEKLGLVCHSQGTTQALVALAKEQRPELGKRISVFCALAPAAYSGPLINKVFFKFMRLLTPGMFRLVFGIHAFIPIMMTMHKWLPRKFYGWMGYLVFSFLFGWNDANWDRHLRDRFFQFSPVYVSAESMRWWLGRECFAKHKCILSTRTEGQLEDEEDLQDDEARHDSTFPQRSPDDRGQFSWYDERAPPMAFWVCGDDELVDGRRLLRRFDRGREPHVDIVHQKVIEHYQHLDVIWAIDFVDMVGKEVKEIIWKTANEATRKQCRVPEGCDDISIWKSGRSQ